MSAVLIPTASEAEWLERRREGVTASEIAVLMGLSPYDSPYGLYHRKLGILPQQDDAGAMERGRVLEPYIAAKFAERHPERFVCGDGRELWRHGDRPWQMATPDRTLGNPDSVLECKVDGGSDDWGEPGTDEIPVHYRAQALWQMDVMGVGTAHVACLRVLQWDVREYVITMDDAARADLELMRAEAREFLDRLGIDPPEVDWRPATLKALKTMYVGEDGGDIKVRASLAISYAAAVRKFKAAERRKDQMTAAVLEAIGNRRRAIDPRTGEPIATRSVSHPKRIDAEMLRTRYPAIAAECTKPPKPEPKLTPAKPKKDPK
jgi:putative phage-type endonuclease